MKYISCKMECYYAKMYRGMKKEDRLNSGHTLTEYERQYNKAIGNIICSTDYNWIPGNIIKPEAIEKINSLDRKELESMLYEQNGNLYRKSIDVSI